MKPAWTIGARSGPVRNYQDLRLMACEGLVCIIDERLTTPEDERYTVVTPSELEHRIKSVDRPYRDQGRMDLPAWKRPIFDQQKQGCQNATECIKEAREMGDPSNPVVQLFWAKHRRTSTVRVRFSAGSDAAGYPELPALDRGPVTGRTTRDDGILPTVQINPVPEHHIHQAPRSKRRQIVLLD